MLNRFRNPNAFTTFNPMIKRMFVLLTVLLFSFSCAEKKEENVTGAIAETSNVAENKPTSEVVIPSYDFTEFEERYLQPEDETTYVINFWATWCKPCIEEMPAFEALREHYEDKNVKVILVSLDLPKLLEKQVVPFVEKKGLQSEVILLDDPDANTWIPKVAEEWSGAIPATLIIKGEQRQFYEQSFTYETLEKAVNSI
tara:strand:+ start:103 stop:699 length:597 start_codon:yes stop_codon:yes gene_type:complete